MVTADHGNLEELTTPEGTPHVSHTANPVEFILIDPLSQSRIELTDGRLADIAPTILSAMGISQPDQMTGKDLAPEHDWNGKRQVLLIILDGWGIGEQNENNPIFLADTPVWDELLKKYPHSQLQASGEHVGLVVGKNGNSEAGHMNIGAGRVILQDDVRLDQSMQDGSFEKNEIFCRTLDDVKQKQASLHLIGLLTEKSSHGSMAYPLALLKMAKAAGLKKVFMHMIFDGRSTEPGSAPALLEKTGKTNGRDWPGTNCDRNRARHCAGSRRQLRKDPTRVRCVCLWHWQTCDSPCRHTNNFGRRVTPMIPTLFNQVGAK